MNDTTRICLRPGCGKPLVRRQNEQAIRFKLRKFCGKTCQVAMAKKNFVSTGRGYWG